MKPLIPRRLRVLALLTAALAWTVLIALGGLVSGHRRPGKLDGTLSRGIDGLVGQRSRLAEVLVTPTDTLVVLALLALLVAVGLITHRWEVAILAVIGPGIAVSIVELALKPLFDRRMYGELSYPSGHMVAAVSALTVALLVVASTARWWLRLVIAAVWAALVVVLMVGLVAMDYHYPTDTIGGLCLSLGVILPLALVADRVRFRDRPEIPAPRVGGTGRPSPAGHRSAAASRDSATSREMARRYFLR